MRHSKLPILLALSLLAAAVQAQLVPVGDEFLVSTEEVVPYDFSRRQSPEVAVGPEGEFVVAWAYYPETFQGRSFAADGTPGGEFTIAHGSGYRLPAEIVAISQAPDGEVVVSWLGVGPLGTPILPAVFGRRYSTDGTAIGESFLASPNPLSGNQDPAVARGPGGAFVMVWDGFDYDDATGIGELPGIRGRRFDPAGDPRGDVFIVEAEGGGSPDVAIAPAGDFLVVWSGFDASRYAIRGRLYGADGEPATEAFTVNADTAGSVGLPAVTATPEGRFLVVWSSTTPDGSGDFLGNVRGQLFASDAVALGGELQINTYTTGRQTSPAVAAGPGGEVVVTWRTAGPAGTEEETYNVRARLLAADGSPVGDDFQVNTATAGVQALTGPAVSVGPQGDVVIVWDHRGGLPYSFESSIRGRRFELPEVPPSPAACDDPRILCLGDGGRFEIGVEWTDFEGDSGPGRRVGGPARTPESGLFYFFDPDNWEILIKVLDGCGTNDHYWVFASATTNVAYTITVTDTLADRERVYSNPLGTAAPAITDIEAFATCD